jgi:cell wall-associated NlpC family hydrolase
MPDPLHIRRSTAICLALLALPLLLACVGGAASTRLHTTTLPRWACPSATPLPYGEQGPVKRSERVNCETDPLTGDEDCDERRIYYGEYEQEYGLPLLRPTTYGKSGTSFYLGQRVQVGAAYALVTAEVLSTTVGTDRQLIALTVEWTNPNAHPLPIDYARQLTLRSLRRPDGRILADGRWGLTAEALTAAGLPLTPPTQIPPGVSTARVALITPAGTPDSVELRLDHSPAALATTNPWSVTGPASVSAAQIDSILAANSSPAAGHGATFVAMGARYGIDPVFALAFFAYESTFGRDPFHRLPDGSHTHNIGNITCSPNWNGPCKGRFRIYASWEQGIEDWFRLIRRAYVDAGYTTIDTIIPRYAPPFENTTDLYLSVTRARVSAWRAASTVQAATPAAVSSDQLTVQWNASHDPHCDSPGVTTAWGAGPNLLDSTPGSGRRRALELALQQVGKPYVWGAAGPHSFDCSGLVQWAYAQVGLSIPRTTYSQYPALVPVELAGAQPGDLIFFRDTDSRGGISHVGMYAGDLDGDGRGDMVHAATPALGVRVESHVFGSDYWRRHLAGIRRVGQ